MLEYKVIGSDPAKEYVIFLHGIGGSANIFFPQMKAFKKSFNLIAVNLPGHKKSSSVSEYKGGFSFDDVTEEVLKVLDEIGVEKAHFVGISLGSVVIHKILSVAPHRVSTAVLGGAITRINLLAKMLLLWGTLLKNVTPHLWLYSLCARILMPNDNHKDSRNAFIQEAAQMKRQDFLGWYDIVHTVPETFTNIETTAASVPKLYLTGEDDHMFKKDVTKDLTDMPKATLIVLSNSGHVVNLDQPDAFNKVSLTFMQTKGQVKAQDLEDNVYSIKS
ncbi:alpha/beta fold hydrolase [Halobacillus litoralis]|uniref:Alpha/beta hydrolase n=1 Tax=Halobacillus litoralis TaxID=45668 RepID=A0A410MI61_9BACI|nr:alpha/beta hydrolase [Halobacillus litoralis]QAS54422.1 alpha/beta hydrolase [Halobacillus litoralis]